MNKKEVILNGTKFIISYFSDENQVQYIDELNVYRTIVVLYQPVRDNEYQAMNIIKSNEHSLLQEVMQLVEANQNFYKHFNYNFEYGFVGRTTQLGKDRTGQELVISIELTIDIRLK